MTPEVVTKVEVVAATPESTPEPTALVADCDKCVPGYHQADKSLVEAEIMRVFGTREAIAVGWAESGIRSNIFNGSCCYGIFQIHLMAHWRNIPGDTKEAKIDYLMDYKNNIAFAKGMHGSSGWNPWEAYTNGSYKKYL